MPAMLAASYVLTAFADRALPAAALPRPLLMTILGVLIAQLLITVLIRRLTAGALATTATVAAILLPGQLEPVLTLLRPISDVRVLLPVLGLMIAAELFRRRRGIALRLRWPSAATPAVIVGLLFAISALRAVSSPTFVVAHLLESSSGPTRHAAPNTPDIYLILLDAYPRSDVLAEHGYDNSEFEAELSARGFEVAAASFSQYSLTSLVIPTLFNMAHASDIPALRDAPASVPAQRAAIQRSLVDSPALNRLRDLGYWTVSAGFPKTFYSLADVDAPLDDGALLGFERSLFYDTLLDGVFPPSEWLADQRRRKITTAFEAIHMVARAERQEPTFMFTHVLAPHAAFVFDEDGSPVTPSCMPQCRLEDIHPEPLQMSDGEFWGAYWAQVQHTNTMTLAAIDAIIQTSPDAVVVVFSDHGTRADLSDYSEWFLTFFAARAPGHAELFPADARPIEIFPRIFSAYFGDDVPVPDSGRKYLPPELEDRALESNDP
jgi:hypothetical protein